MHTNLDASRTHGMSSYSQRLPTLSTSRPFEEADVPTEVPPELAQAFSAFSCHNIPEANTPAESQRNRNSRPSPAVTSDVEHKCSAPSGRPVEVKSNTAVKVSPSFDATIGTTNKCDEAAARRRETIDGNTANAMVTLIDNSQRSPSHAGLVTLPSRRFPPPLHTDRNSSPNGSSWPPMPCVAPKNLTVRSVRKSRVRFPRNVCLSCRPQTLYSFVHKKCAADAYSQSTLWKP